MTDAVLGYTDAYIGRSDKLAADEPFTDSRKLYRTYRGGTPEEKQLIREKVEKDEVPLTREDMMVLRVVADRPGNVFELPRTGQRYKQLKARLLGYANSTDMEYAHPYDVKLREAMWEEKAGIRMNPAHMQEMYNWGREQVQGENG